MNEGLILLDEKLQITSINPCACTLFDTDIECIGSGIESIIKDNGIKEIMLKGIKNNNTEAFFEIASEKYRVEINSVALGNNSNNILIIIFNISEYENSEKMRREFTANVSHELKTPLQSISGYAELLNNGLARPEDTKNFVGKIYSEAQRMIHLIEDIIHLSRLDEGAADMTSETVDIYEIAKETADNLYSEAQQASVEISVHGSSAKISAIPHLISGIIFNLCDNAIKYNKKNGSVDIIVENDDKNVILTVKDTGIGIPSEDYARIFERFYRVDKSRSKEVGGTGLGLSIVKHAAIIHKAKIELKSIINKGTSIIVTFPK